MPDRGCGRRSVFNFLTQADRSREAREILLTVQLMPMSLTTPMNSMMTAALLSFVELSKSCTINNHPEEQCNQCPFDQISLIE